ncbi:hypothetical protein BDV98DRAFT_175672 [Pterulicium gracile]|uniref:Uncharacterized protein n=1 Tax=Pterulicium gracile TaxID=1884261 RepID=A0A5C3QBZ1_9AGAR|nr:hypothetical protein BDV98DRAFT_175672 [Pterula gracilis]
MVAPCLLGIHANASFVHLRQTRSANVILELRLFSRPAKLVVLGTTSLCGLFSQLTVSHFPLSVSRFGLASSQCCVFSFHCPPTVGVELAVFGVAFPALGLGWVFRAQAVLLRLQFSLTCSAASWFQPLVLRIQLLTFVFPDVGVAFSSGSLASQLCR